MSSRRRKTSKGASFFLLYLISIFFIPFSFLFQAALDDATEPWGIKVERVEM
jgi:hypothetical protein